MSGNNLVSFDGIKVVGFRFKKQDLWFGAYYEKGEHNVQGIDYEITDVWICLFPCLPLHIQRNKRIQQSKENRII